jgi:hypothetical protein
MLKDRRRPVFEGQWACSEGCVKAMVQAVIRRQAGAGELPSDEGPHRHRIPLGLILLERGWITQTQLQHALNAQLRAGTGRIGQWLNAECGLDQDRITRALGVQLGCPVLPMEGFDPEAMALVLPKVLVEESGIVPLRVAGKRILYLAFRDRLGASAAFAVERMSGHKTESGLVDPVQWKSAQERICACEFVVSTHEQAINIDQIAALITAALRKMQPRASRLVRVHQIYWLRMWLETGAMRASDGEIPTTSEDVVDRIYSLEGEE